MAQILSQEDRARQRQNSLNEQLDRFRRTGRLTKGLQREGYRTVAPTEFVAQSGDSPFSVAAQLLGQGATQSQIAAFVQSQGWSRGFRAGKTYRVRGATLTPNARPSAGFMAAVTGQPQTEQVGGQVSATPAQPQVGQQQAPTPGSGVPSLPNATSSADMLAQKLGVGAQTNPVSDAIAALQRKLQEPVVTGDSSQLRGTAGANATSTAPANLNAPGLPFAPGVPVPSQQRQTQRQPSGPYLPPTPTGAQPSLSVQEQQFFSSAAQQRDVMLAIGTWGSTSGQAATPPPSITADVHDSISWPTDPLTGAVVDPYVSSSNGTYSLDPQFTASITAQNAYYEQLNSIGTSPSATTNPYVDTGWSPSDARGVSPFIRPRRSGVGATGAETITPADVDAAVYGSYAGTPGLQSSWNIGF